MCAVIHLFSASLMLAGGPKRGTVITKPTNLDEINHKKVMNIFHGSKLYIKTHKLTRVTLKKVKMGVICSKSNDSLVTNDRGLYISDFSRQQA
jgi:hypothetical protein